MHEKKILFILIAFSILAAFWWGSAYARPPIGGDEFTYDVTAYTLSQKGIIGGFQTFNQYVQRPAYPLAISFVYKIFGYKPILIFFLQIILAAFTIGIVFSLTKKIFGSQEAIIASLIFIAFPSIWAYTGIMMREVLYVFLFMAALALSWLVLAKKKNWLSFSLGCALGILSLTNLITLLLILPISIFLFFRLKKEISLKKNTLLILLIVLPFLGIVGGWMIFQNAFIQPKNITGDTLGLYLMEKYERMLIIQKKFPTYFLAHALGDTFAYSVDPSYNHNTLRLGHNTRLLYHELTKNFPVQMIEKKFFYEALRGISRHPLAFFEQSLIEFFKLNAPLIPLTSIQPIFIGENNSLPRVIQFGIIAFFRILFYAMLAAGISIAVKNRKKNPAYYLFLIFILYLEALHIFVYSIPRYILPLYPIFFMILAPLFHSSLVHYFQYKSSNENLERK